MKFYTIWLALICILIFLIQNLVPNFTSTFILDSSKATNEPWRLFTSIFLHNSLLHLIYNLFALILFGLILEKIIGSTKFLILFLSSGITASLAATILYSMALGASGAIFGIIGTLTVLRPLMAVWAFSLPMPMFIAAILWAAGDLLGLAAGGTGIAHLAHLAGLAFGLFSGLILKITNLKFSILKKPNSRKGIKIPESYMQEWEERYMRS